MDREKGARSGHQTGGVAPVDSNGVTSADAWSVQVSFLGLERFPEGIAEPLSPLTRLVISTPTKLSPSAFRRVSKRSPGTTGSLVNRSPSTAQPASARSATAVS